MTKFPGVNCKVSGCRVSGIQKMMAFLKAKWDLRQKDIHGKTVEIQNLE